MLVRCIYLTLGVISLFADYLDNLYVIIIQFSAIIILLSLELLFFINLILVVNQSKHIRALYFIYY